MDHDRRLAHVRALAADFAAERVRRQGRREADPADFRRLAATGFLATGLPAERGGDWTTGSPPPVRAVAGLLKALAAGDPSVALVAAMHPAVLSYWLAPQLPAGNRDAAAADQRSRIFDAVEGGEYFSTITSEPGSGGDILKTKTAARPTGAAPGYALTGTKHFGSGSGIASFMVTTAVPDGESEPAIFLLDVRAARNGPLPGMRLVAPWDGHGMTATQSHAFAFESLPAERFAGNEPLRAVLAATGGFIGCCFAAVIAGIVETALEEARRELSRRRGALRPFEQVGFAEAETEAWLVGTALEGMIRAVEADGGTPRDILLGKPAISALAESCLRRLCAALGGATYSRHSPFGHWFEDVRALGFLRPPWSLAFDRILEGSFGGER